MPSIAYYVLCGVLAVGVLAGIYMMSKVKTSVIGNSLSAMCMFIAILVTMAYKNIFDKWVLYPCVIIGTIIGLIWAKKVKMIQMPQLVALFNGVGGGASALVAMVALLGIGTTLNPFTLVTSTLALSVGIVTLVGSLIAAGKLHKVLPQKPIVVKGHQAITTISLVLILAVTIMSAFNAVISPYIILGLCIAVSLVFGIFFAIRVGGADMPVVISLLNSLSGVAAAIAGMAINDYLLVAVGGIVGASGLLLTQIMCKSMNRKLSSILLGKTSVKAKSVKKNVVKEVEKSIPKQAETKVSVCGIQAEEKVEEKVSNAEILQNAKSVIIVPGYGMALAQAQHLVKQVADKFKANGADVKYAIHPVAGRMPGHMNVLLCEANVDYEDLYQMEDINDDFKKTDVVVVVGANDVLNPAARNAEGTPIYGMPVLNVDDAKHIVICNYDLKPGYAGVKNPLYSKKENVELRLGDASVTLQGLLKDLNEKIETKKETPKTVTKKDKSIDTISIVRNAKSVIIVPGYGMALGQAQHLVKQLSEKLKANGSSVKFAIHPVAGRMPGHMNVLLCEANVDYEDLYQMEEINDEFKDTDLVIIVGANDVINPAARNAEGTPIYGMPVLNVDDAKHVIICNYDLKPGYAGVENPLYSNKTKVSLMLGDASVTLQNLLNDLSKDVKVKKETPKPKVKKEKKIDTESIVKNAKNVIIVPGYGMALAQAQHLVKQVADKFRDKGANVKYAIHPVAGRMPGHMNVLLCEANVDYEDLYQMQDVNDDFKNTDLVIIVGANDVINPAARNAEGTPIYGMPVLNVDDAKNIIICNFDLKPGYAGVENPLYSNKTKVSMLLGDAKDSLNKLLEII